MQQMNKAEILLWLKACHRVENEHISRIRKFWIPLLDHIKEDCRPEQSDCSAGKVNLVHAPKRGGTKNGVSC